MDSMIQRLTDPNTGSKEPYTFERRAGSSGKLQEFR